MAVGDNIKKRRFELNLSQQELAGLMGYRSRSTIAKIESGENDISQRKLHKFAQVLDTTVDALIGSAEAASGIKPASFTPSPGGARTAVIILAGGKSIRNQQNVPNQFINILGKPVIIYCMEAYQNHPAVDDIYVICLKGWEGIVTAYAQQYGITKLRGMIPGGSTGVLSIKNGLDAIGDRYAPEDTIIIQESTRPMVTVDMISKLLQSCQSSGTATIAHSMKDYVQFAAEGNKTAYIDRNKLMDLQSPEAHKLSRLQDIFREAEQKNHALTESCCTMLMYNLGREIKFIEGSTLNLKIVRQEDIAIATALLKQNY